MLRRAVLLVLVVLSLALAAAPSHAADWPQFGFDARHDGWNPAEAAIRADTVAGLHRLYSVHLSAAMADSAPVYLAGATTAKGRRDLLFVETMEGQVFAVDAGSGAVVWTRQLPGGPRYTTSAPALDPDRLHLYAYGLEGRVHKLAVADGAEVTAGGWPQLATQKPQVEKCSSALALATAAGRTYLYAVHGGYPGDAGDYQGHVTAIDLASGAQKVWNAACSDQMVHLNPGSCAHVQNAVWARPGVVYDASLGRIFLATGNGDFDAVQGGRDWGDSLLALTADGSTGAGGMPVDSYTPAEYQRLQSRDLDLGSSGLAILPAPAGSRVAHLGLQVGKDGQLRLLDLANLSGQGGPAHVGGELQILPVPQGGGVLPMPAVWVDPAGVPWVFVSNGAGISGLAVTVADGGAPRLAVRWTSPVGGTSPIVVGAPGAAGSVLFQATRGGGLRALAPATGAQLWSDGPTGGLHWQSPIAVDGRLFLADDDGNLTAYGLAAPAPCVADDATLCLGGGRFAVRATWETVGGTAGTAHAVGLTGDTGYLWFFNPANVEAVVKVIDGCGIGSGAHWVFAGGLTDVAVLLTVTDTQTGTARTYANPQGKAFQPIQDTGAFPTCP